MFMTLLTIVCPFSLSWFRSNHFTSFHYISDMHFNNILPATPWFSNWPRSSLPHIPSILPSLIFHRYNGCRWEDNIEGKQRTCNIISRFFNVSTVAVKQQLVLYRVIKKSLCTGRLQYNHQVHRDFLITLYILRVFLQPYLTNTQSTCAILYWLLPYLPTSFECHKRKKLLNIKCVFGFSLQLLP
jgi:hypothetical protein